MSALPVTSHRSFSPSRVLAICSITLLELIRLKVFYILLLFSVAIIGSSLLMVDLTFQEEFQMLKDVSLGAMSIFTWLLAVLPTALLLPKDTEDRTLYTILAKPVGRFEYLLGKLLGVLCMVAIATVLMTAVSYVVLYVHEQSVIHSTARLVPPEQVQAATDSIRAAAFGVNLLPGVAVLYCKAALCAALTLFISTFSSSWIFTVSISVCVYLIGHVQSVARDAMQMKHPMGDAPLWNSLFLLVVTVFFPDLHIFSLVDDLAVGTPAPPLLIAEACGLGLAYTCGYLLLAYLMFAWKEL